MSIKKPDINCWLLDRFLIMAEHENLKIQICFNKIDLGDREEIDLIADVYRRAKYNVIETSTKSCEGIGELKNLLKKRILQSLLDHLGGLGNLP